MNITYTQNGDYLIPNIVIRKTKPIGHYGDMLGYLRTSMKNFHYALTRTSLINGLDANAKVVKVTPWWRYAIFGVDAAFALMTLGCAYMMWRSGRRGKNARETVKVESETATGK